MNLKTLIVLGLLVAGGWVGWSVLQTGRAPGVAPSADALYVESKELKHKLEMLRERDLHADARQVGRMHENALSYLERGELGEAEDEIRAGKEAAEAALDRWRVSMGAPPSTSTAAASSTGSSSSSSSSSKSSGGTVGGGMMTEHAATVDIIGTVSGAQTTPRLRGVRGKANRAADAVKRNQAARDAYADD